MAAAALVSAQDTLNGLYPVRLRRDLAAMADLIEYCFAPTLDAGGRAAIQEMRTISRSGPLLWFMGSLNRVLPGFGQGFVWYEGGRLVGNVSITPAGYGRGFVIANVAVYPEYRRRGIARRLMVAALEKIAREGAFATLQVEADNEAARALYQSLGFETLRLFTRWRRATYYRMPDPLPESLPLHPLTRRDAERLVRLARRVRPNERGGLGWLRPTEPKHLRPSALGIWWQLLSGTGIHCWGVGGPDGELEAALVAETRLGGLTTMFDLLVAPERQGALEAPLLHQTISLLGGRYQPLMTEHPADDETMNEALHAHYFKPERTLDHMIWRAG